jgi:2,5-diketo-D-gluconate reductase B
MEMPVIGLGTWQLHGQECTDVVKTAIAVGYRHIDTAQMYENEQQVGTGIRAAGVARDQLFVVTKINQDRFTDGTALQSAHKSIDALGVGAANLILCHWPPRTVETEAVIDSLLAIKDAGLTENIGISNFNVSQMERAAARAKILTNQVEFHPLIDQTRVVAAARRTSMSITGYMPIIRGEALTLPVVIEIAEEIDRTATQVVLRWVTQQGVVALCKSNKRDRLIENLGALDFTLSDDQMARITALTSANKRYAALPDWAPDWDA